MPKNLQVLTLKADAELVEAIRAHAGPRGMTRYILGLVVKDMGWDSEPTPALPVSVHDAVVRSHPFKPGKSPFRCEVCGQSQGGHP